MPNPSTLEPNATQKPLHKQRLPHGIKGEELVRFGELQGVPMNVQETGFKELTNKVAWVLGSTYRLEYSKRGSDLRDYARMIAHAIVRDHGYLTP